MKKTIFFIAMAFLALFAACTAYDDTNESFTIKFQPLQCTENPWESEAGETQVDQIKNFYSEHVDLENVKRVEPDRMVCEACETCPTQHYFTAEVDNQEDFAFMITQGWDRIDD
ncbi:MAG: hypothetical protein ACOCXG_01025 [Nanoarchaeota archaeon]